MISPEKPQKTVRARFRQALCGLLAVTAVAAASPVLSQSLPVLDYSGRLGEQRPELLEPRPTTPAPAVVLPAPPLPPHGFPGTLLKSVFVRRINVTGSTVFSPEALAVIATPYENRFLSMEDLELLRRDLTLLYIKSGYVNSGAVIPDQDVTDGVVTMQLVEGRLAAIAVDGAEQFQADYLRDRIALGAGIPLGIAPLQDRLQLLQQDRRIASLQAELRPGSRAGEAELKVHVEEKPPISLWLAFNNYLSPAIGEEQGLATVEHQNLTGRGDVFSFTYGYAEGVEPMIDAWYALPLNAHDTTLQFRYRQSDQTVVDDVFGPLDIVSEERAYELALRHPVYRSLTQEVALSVSLERERNRNFLLGDPFSFSPGEKHGEAVVAPLRMTQEWTYRTQRQVIAARSRFSFGLDAFGATVHGDDQIPDGKFFAWLGQVQYAQILDAWDIQLLARADIQRTDDSLLPVEQMGLGGRYSVRGYRENLLVRDQAVVASLETRIPLVQDVGWADYLQFCQFFDYGKGTNVDLPTPDPSDISSVGLGLRWGATLFKLPFELRGDAEIYWGYQLRDVEDLDAGAQDDGIHYQFAITGYF